MIKYFILLFVLFSTSLVYAAGPVSPTGDLMPTTNKDGKLNLDNLPYKPVDPNEQRNKNGEPVQENIWLTELKVMKVDWSTVPYVPSKYPQIGPAPDPKF